MKEIEINNPTMSYVCEYCGYTSTARDGYYSITRHEQVCGKNPKNIAIAKNAVGKVYKTSSNNLFVKVLKYNEDYKPIIPSPIVRDGFSPMPTSSDFFCPISEQFPLYIKEIEFKSYEGVTFSCNVSARYSDMICFDKMIETTQEEWDAAIKRIAEEDRKCDIVSD